MAKKLRGSFLFGGIPEGKGIKRKTQKRPKSTGERIIKVAKKRKPRKAPTSRVAKILGKY